MNIIGVNGFKRSGKSETGNAIERLLDNVQQVGFADKLKVYTARALGYSTLSEAGCIALMDEGKQKWVVEVLGDEIPENTIKNLTMRQLLQNVGTEARNL